MYKIYAIDDISIYEKLKIDRTHLCQYSPWIQAGTYWNKTAHEDGDEISSEVFRRPADPFHASVTPNLRTLSQASDCLV